MSGHAYEYIDMEDHRVREESYDDVAAPGQPEGEVQYLQPAGLPAPGQQEGEDQYLQPAGLQAVYLHPQIEARQQDDNASGYLQPQQKSRQGWCTLERKIIIALATLLMLLVSGALVIGITAFHGGQVGYGWTKWGSWSSCNCKQERVRSCTAPEQHHDKYCPGQDREIRNCSFPGPGPLPCHKQAPVCYLPYMTFSKSYRRESVGNQLGYCDKDKVDGTSWYRFNLSSGENGVLQTCPKYETCGTGQPIWMVGEHPTQYGDIKDVTMAASNGDNCHRDSGPAQVTKCHVDGEDFFLYKLWKPTTLPSKRNATLGLGASLTPIWGQRPHGVKKLSTGVVSPILSHKLSLNSRWFQNAGLNAERMHEKNLALNP